jgi:CRP-like cAMP-binding protein
MTDELEGLRMASSVFSGLDDEALRRVSEVATPFDVPAGRVLAEHGQPGSGLFVLTEGTVEVDLPSGKAVTLGPGEFVGELSVLADIRRTARVRALTPVQGLAISRSAFEALLREEPRIAVAMLPVLARRLAEAESEAGHRH